MTRTLVIAEPGSTHDGHYNRMLDCIKVAARAGADVVKFQWLSSAERLAERRHAAEYLHAYRAIAFPSTWHAKLQEAALIEGLEYACTVYLPEDVPIIVPHVERFKIASFEALDRAFIASHFSHRKPLLISTGMLTEDQVNALAWWARHRSVTLLHCTSAYPCPPDQAHLRCITTLRERAGLEVGYSDHTAQIRTGALAVAAGASVVEVHCRPEGANPDNPDYGHSLPPEALSAYIARIREAETMLGSGEKVVQEAEAAMRPYQVPATR